VPLPHDPGPHWGEVGIHGLHRQREWDTVVAVEADLEGEEAVLVALPGGRVLVESGRRGADWHPLLAAVGVPRPFRAHAVRRGGRTWVVAARAIQVVELGPDVAGDEVELAFDGAERSVRVDGEPTLAPVPELEALVGGRFAAYVVRAARLEGPIWEVEVAPL
jgi:hypothetical protein